MQFLICEHTELHDIKSSGVDRFFDVWSEQ
jgi:hypothetical protein